MPTPMTTDLRDADDGLDDILAAYRLDILAGRSHSSSAIIEWTMHPRVVSLPAFGVRRHRITLTDRPRMRELRPRATVKLVGPTYDQWSEWTERSGQAGWATLSILSILAVILLGLAMVSHRAIG